MSVFIRPPHLLLLLVIVAIFLLIFTFSTEKKDEESFSIKEGYEGNLDNSVTTSPIFLPQGQTSIHSISPNVTCLNKPIEFQQVKNMKVEESELIHKTLFFINGFLNNDVFDGG